MRRMKHIAIIFILLISSTLHSAQDTASFEISAYNIGLDPGAPEGSIYIEIGDAVTGGILDSSDTIVIPNIEDMLVDDISSIKGGDHPDHNEEIVFSYLINGDGFNSISDATRENKWNYSVSVSMTPFTNTNQSITSNNIIDSKFRIQNTTATFEDGSSSYLIGNCYHDNYWPFDDSSIDIYVHLDDSGSINGHVSSGSEVAIHTWAITYDQCKESGYPIKDHSYGPVSSVKPWYIRGAVSLIFDREAYENASAGTYSSTVTLTLKTGN